MQGINNERLFSHRIPVVNLCIAGNMKLFFGEFRMRNVFPSLFHSSGNQRVVFILLIYLAGALLSFNLHFCKEEKAIIIASGSSVECEFSNNKSNINKIGLFHNLALYGILFSVLGIFSSDRNKNQKTNKKDQFFSSQTYKEVFLNSPCLLLIVDENLKLIDINKSGLEFSGKQKKEISDGLPGIVLNCIRGDEAPGCGNHPECNNCPLRQAIEQTIEKGITVKNKEAEFTSKREKEPVYYNTLISTSPISFEGEKGVLVSITDITKQKHTEEQLLKAEVKFQTFAEYTYDWEFWLDPNNLPVYHSPSCKRISGYSAKEFMNSPALIRDIIHKDDVEIWDNHLSKPFLGLYPSIIEFRIITADGNIKWLEHACSQVYDNSGNYIGRRGSSRDVTERVLTHRLYKAQVKLSEMSLSCSLDELIQATLDDAESLSQSKIGFFHFVEPDQKNLRLQMWSTNTVKNMCSAAGKGDHYSIDKAGVWVDCVHQRKPVIHNCYEELPHKKGLPEGHAPVIREMVIPVIRNEKITAIIGVGNKPVDYNTKDLELITKLVDLIWDIIHKKQIEAELVRSEKKYRRMIETSCEGIIITDIKGIIAYTNPQACKLLGYSTEELQGKPVTDLFYNSSKDVPFADIEKTNEMREEVLIKKDGTECNVIIASSQIDDEDNTRSGRLLMITDITAQKLAEEKIKLSEETYRLIVENQTELIVKANPEGNLIFVSPSYCNLFGKTENELLNKSYIPLIHEDDQEPTMREMKKLYTPPYTCYIEQRVYTKHGLRWIAWNDKAVFDESGKMQKIIATGRDITEKKIADDALKVSEEKFFKAFHINPDSININRMRDGLYIDVNDGFCKMTGFTREEVIGKTSSEINIWANSADRERLVAALKKEGECQNLEAQFRFKDGKVRTGLMSAKIINFNNEVCILSISRDISERKSAEELIRKSLLEKETLLRELYHRTKNNMQVISAILTLQSASATNKEVIEILNETSNRIKAMSLVHQKLYQSNDLSKIHLSEYIKEIIDLLMDFYKVDKTQIEVIMSLADEYVLIDYAIPCGLVLNEIVSNAFKYAFPEGRMGRIEVNLDRDEKSRIRITFKDNGIGLPPGFDYKAPGTLGLMLVHSLVEHQLDGVVDIKSENGVEITFAFFDNLYEIRI